MRIRRPPWLCVALSAVALSAGCAWGGSSEQVVSTPLADDRVAFIKANWAGGARRMSVLPYAQVPEGTRGTLEVSGPASWRCRGVFRPWSPAGGQLPPGVTEASEVTYFAPQGSDTQYPWPTLDFAGLPGSYAFTLTVEDPRGTLSVTVDYEPGVSGGGHGPSGCIQTGGPPSSSPSPTPSEFP